MIRQLLSAAAALIWILPLSARTCISDKEIQDKSIPDSTITDKTTLVEISEMVGLVISSLAEDDAKSKFDTLTEEDFLKVAKELDVEVAAIKAVVRIEAGPKLQGFWAPGVPVVNYAQSLFNKYNGKVKGKKIKDGKVPQGLSGYALKEWTSLTNARKINAAAADMGTYWGMFQIGGYNYKLCGCQNIEEMVEKMCESELSQLEMFAVFIRNAGMLESLKKKDWSAFARKYNGPSYAKRGYHTRMAKEYANFKSKENQPANSEKSIEQPIAKSDTIAQNNMKSAVAKKATKRKSKRRTKK